ncbi:MAG: M20/M25/M40 family metallo-hydrolase, partial [Thermoprotei archaeon]
RSLLCVFQLNQDGFDLESVNSRIHSNLQKHIDRIMEIIRIPSIAAENPEGVDRCARYLERWFSEIGCSKTEIFETEGFPVVYGYYDAQAPNTIIVYLMYDVKQVSGETWTLTSDPFEPRLVQMSPFESVLVGRGATNSKGPLGAFLNAVQSIVETGQRVPVNLKFVAEGEEELGSAHLIDFIKQRQGELKDASAVFSPGGSQNRNGKVTLTLGCKGVTEFELVCSGEKWGRGPKQRAIHSSYAAVVESPVWRLVHALASFTDPSDPAKVVVEGFYDNVAKPEPEDLELIERLSQTFDEEALKESLGVSMFHRDVHGKDLLLKAFYTTTLNIQGIYGGYTGPLVKTVLPEKAAAKLESRLIPNQTMTETVEKIRKHLDRHGYSDIEILTFPGENAADDWSRTDPKAGVVSKTVETYREFGFEPEVWPFALGSSPQYMFTKQPLSLPFVSAGLGHGGRAHAPDEYYVVKGNSRVLGLEESEKFYVKLLLNYSDGSLK